MEKNYTKTSKKTKIKQTNKQKNKDKQKLNKNKQYNYDAMALEKSNYGKYLSVKKGSRLEVFRKKVVLKDTHREKAP